jgi:hypothetical protein
LQRSSRLTARLGVSQFIGWSSGFYLPAILAVPISESLGIVTETFFWAFTVALLVAALFAAAILGPSQVLARVLLVALGKVMTPMRVAAVSMLSHPVGVVLILVFGVDALVPFVVLHGIAVGLDPFIRGTLPLLFFGSEQFGQRQGYIMMFSKIVVAFSPLFLTIIVVRNPTAGILTTMGMGIAASVLLIWLAGIRKHRESKKLMAIAN